MGVAPAATAPSGFSLIAEDGNALPGVPRVQSEVFLAAGKTYDVMINAPTAGAPALPIYDRELSLSGNAIARDAGMLAYIGVNGAGLPTTSSNGAAVANPDTYSVVPGKTLTVSDPAKGVIANDINVYGVPVLSAPTEGTLTLNRTVHFPMCRIPANGGDSFTYWRTATAAITALVTLGAAAIEAAPVSR